MSYPPTPDRSPPNSTSNSTGPNPTPATQQPSAQYPSTSLSSHSHYPDESDAADQTLSNYQSSADLYASQGSGSSGEGNGGMIRGVEYDSGTPPLGNASMLTYGAAQHTRNPSEGSPMLLSNSDPNFLSETPLPHSMSRQFSDAGSTLSGYYPHRQSGSFMGEGYNGLMGGLEDPYANYQEANFSNRGSAMNLSIDDGDSQRQLYGGNTSRLTMGDRRSSNLAYGGTSEEEKLDGRDLGGAGVGAGRRTSSSSRAAKLARTPGTGGFWRNLSSRGRKFLILSLLLLVLVIAAAGGTVGAILGRNSKSSKLASTGADNIPTTTVAAPKGVPTGGSTVGGGKPDWRTEAIGGDGSTVYMMSGGSFVYNNTFGGFWNSIPFNDSAQAQGDVPPLNVQWDYNTNLIAGVNLGGWLVIEPFITPSLFEPFDGTTDTPFATDNPVVDEWTLSEALGSNLAATITKHYDTFITEKDFAEIAGAGLNWVRIPLPYWAIEVYPGEPFLANVAWQYFLKAITWARKYGLRINLDLHAVPGSQNGYNHSSKLGSINFLNGVMGIANAQRTLNYIRTLTEFMSQDQYKNVIPMFSVLNEPYAATIGVDVLRHFHIEVYNIVRGITGLGEGKGPFIVFHDGFVAPATSVASGGWNGFFPGADRVAIDQHPYLCFAQPNIDGLSYQAAKPCAYFAEKFNTSSEQFGLSMGGEWSLAINDCGKWVNNIGNGNRYNGTYYQPGKLDAPQYAGVGSCDEWNDWANYSAEKKAGLKMVAQGHQDALRHWFFWTWKTGVSTALGTIANPLWNYQLALQEGYMPRNPRDALGACTALVAEAGAGVSMVNNPAPTLSAWMTGGVGAGTILNQAQSASFGAWPPPSIGAPPTPTAFLPTYTNTGRIITMSASTPTAYPSGYSSVTNPGNGWKQASDVTRFATPVAGCVYPNAWSGVEASIPTAVCTGA